MGYEGLVVGINLLPHATSQSSPQYAKLGDAGFDLRAAIERRIVMLPRSRVVVPNGLGLEIPEGYVGMLCSRSGLAAEKGILVLNAPGIIDSGYRGELKTILFNSSDEPFTIDRGDRISQLLIVPVEKARFHFIQSVSQTERGSAGLGSTGVA